ncbi:hypothetical protein FHX82_005548 [Amycolatopsis bartoniae]|uniref:DUF1996 domain-containing protein n=1 Tax=Amycolatopsis bartoniae TaxID=941986 RepID=A0A8H9M739_9PSEU|nr:DUF1996 domain-containing protein [Amycolatopsis bartoniae]MBB2938470.1 hypothetical protein [Amycolatopsis bartoniae]TVT10378.1 DUF1996 domain-containing protein [Amycolatopsis bartoniae]GHF70772.1 hypothetical protein GCM10017566_50750 [Amycolatopsis bartoniae]
MIPAPGRHRVSKRTKAATAVLALAAALGGTAVAVTAGEPGRAAADAVDKSQFVDITTVAPNVATPAPRDGASTGTFTVDCGKNENQHFNPDNFIAQPGVKNGAQHLHDYVGNLTTNADSTDQSLLAGGTTCKNGDQSAYFWPVVRIDTGDGEPAASAAAAPGDQTVASELPAQDANNELPGNDGEIQQPATVELTFLGSPAGQVTAMPQFLRILFGDAKVSTNGPKNARAGFTCTGFEDRLIDKYPICPEGSRVKRVHDFASCWDGEHTDSANHRDHIVYPDADGQCPQGFEAVPQLRVSLTYDIPREIQLNGQYKIDSFPEEHHNPASEHDDFANVMSQEIMNRVVGCLDTGRTCQE